jgi:hypothetical protein
VLAFNLSDRKIFELVGIQMPKRFTQQEFFSAVMKAYNLRSGGVETSFKNSKQGLRMNKRNKKRFEAQHLLIDEKGKVNLIILNKSHKLAKSFHPAWQTCFARDDLSLILGKI